MKELKTVYFIGCGVLGPDINHIADKLNLKLKKKMLPGGLHEQPAELQKRLQKAIDKAGQDESCSRIIVGYGLCGKGTVGIRAPGVPLVFPKVHDCIALFMGSDQAYREEFARYPGTFYISAGWFQEKERPEKEKLDQIWVGSHAMGCKEITEKYGEKGGKQIIHFFTTWQKNYQRAAFIDTGIGKAGQFAEHAQKMARKYNWEYKSIKGSLSLMSRLLTSVDSDDQILVVPADYMTIYSSIDNKLAAAPSAQTMDSSDSGPRLFLLDKEEDRGLSIQYGLGVDAGGTYTDAAVYNFKDKVLSCKNKALTTKWDFSIGIDQAISKLKKDILGRIELVAVSTTLATNAIVEGEGQKAGLILMSGNGMVSDQLITHFPRIHVKGRMSIEGKPTEPIDPDEIRQKARQMIENNGVKAFAVSGFAGTKNPSHELEVKRILQQETGMVVSCGHELSDLLNFVVRAQTAVLNARIIPRMIRFFKALDSVLKKRGIKAPVMVVKGDGTLMPSSMARQRPVETILSGPAASAAGAKLLTGLKDAMVVDIGGTTTDTADLAEGMVNVCESGARVGGFDTHVKALNMRTIGLGGDSLICWHKEKLLLGPRRVAPMVWADDQTKQGVDQALKFMESRLKSNSRVVLSQIVLTAVKGKFPFNPTQEERNLYKILIERPYALEELAQPLNLLSARFLSFQRLEESGLIQRCGLTPTDILHVTGRFNKWNPGAARRMVKIVAAISKNDPEKFIATVLERLEKDLAKELLRKQLAKDVNVDEDKETELSRHLMECILSGKKTTYYINVRLENPIIGIGAPVHYFLPKAGKRLSAEVIIPEHADVANAAGAVTSHIMIKQKVSIQPDYSGCFAVQGIEGGKQFKDIDKAEAWAVNYLKHTIQNMGRLSGTSRKTVEIKIMDRIANAGDGTSLFLERTIAGTLSGSPDLVLDRCRIN